MSWLVMACMWVRSNIPAFQHSLADISRWGWGMWALELVAVSAALTSIGESIIFPCAPLVLPQQLVS